MRSDEPNDGFDALVGQLPRDASLPADLWPQIMARLATEHCASASTPESLAPRLAAEAAPPEHLWEGIAARLAPRRAHAPRSRLALVAVAASVAVIAVLAAILLRAPPPQPQAVDAANLAPRALPWIFDMPAIDAAVAAEFLRNYELVHAERLAIESAIEVAPDNLLLRDLWAHAYTAELELSGTLERTIMTYQRGNGI